MRITTAIVDGHKPRTRMEVYDPETNKMHVVEGENLWTEITVAKTGEYLGWVPVPLVEAHGKGYLSLRAQRAAAMPNTPEGLQRTTVPWK